MSPVLTLLPSPLLGPAVWSDVAQRLRLRGWTVAELPPLTVAPQNFTDALNSFVSGLPENHDLVLIPHSNAGLFVPALTLLRNVEACVFVDAIVPPSSGSLPIAASPFSDFLASIADAEGVLPPWTRWWRKSAVGTQFPDAAGRDRIEREQQRLPLSYFLDDVSVPTGWAKRPMVYLAFGDTYASDRDYASSRGWPAQTLLGEHLHMVVDPESVTAAIEQSLWKLEVSAR
jgi:hypothetical protein